MNDEAMPIKCVLCEQFMMRKDSSKLVCINNKCPDYYEPAAAHPSLFSKKMEKLGKTLKENILDKSPKASGPPRSRPCEYRVGDGKCGREQENMGGLWACRVHNAELFGKENSSEWEKLYGKGAAASEEESVTYGFATPSPGPGIKLDTGKPLVYTEFLMQFPTAMKLVAWVGDQGSRAPGHVRSGWKKVDRGFMRYSEALGRHVLDEVEMMTAEEPSSEDPDHDLLFQVSTVAWNAMARLEHLAKDKPGALARIFGEKQAEPIDLSND